MPSQSPTTRRVGHRPVLGGMLVAACLAGGCRKAEAPPAPPAKVVEPAEPVKPASPDPPPAAEFPADELLAALKSQWLFRNQVKWPEAEADLRARLAAAKTDEQRAAAVVRLFARADDVHSNLQFKGRFYSHYEGLDEAARRKLLPLLERERAQSGKVAASLLDGRHGYLLVPAMPAYTPEQVEKFARDLRGRLAEVAAKKPAGWVVDLRLNGGGNLYPMLLGLAPLLGEGVVGGTVDDAGRLVQEWVLKPDGLYWRDNGGDRRFAALDLPVTLPEPVPPVAVLVGPMTRSSGQATALAFKGRPRCVLLGEPTAKGYTTVTNPVAVRPDAALSLAVGFMADRRGTACKAQVLPEETVEGGDAFDAPAKDQKVQAAIRWLARQVK